MPPVSLGALHKRLLAQSSQPTSLPNALSRLTKYCNVLFSILHDMRMAFRTTEFVLILFAKVPHSILERAMGMDYDILLFNSIIISR